MGLPCGSDGKESACNAEDLSSIPGLGRSPGGGDFSPGEKFLPGETPWTEEPVHKEPDTTERLSTVP